MTDIRRRHVFFISGFDPRGARHYHQMYKEHAAKQSAINGLSLDVSGKRKVSEESSIWQAINTQKPGFSTDIEFLSWDDIIRREWAQGLLPLWRETWYCLKAYILEGASFKLSRVRKSWLKAAVFYQLFYLPAVFLLCAGLFMALYNAFAAQGALFPCAAGMAGAGLLLWAAVRIGNRFTVFWLLRIFSFSAKWARGEMPGIEERVDAFATRVRAALSSGDADEVIVVGHSVGSILAVPVVRRALRGLPEGARIVLMTLGHCIPLVTFHAEAEAYRRELSALAADKRVLWVDYSAPPDGASFPELDPVAASGCAGAGPKILSPRFFKLYREEKYRRLRFDWFNLHFLYMQSSDYAGEYDYFDITAGPRSFADRLKAVYGGKA